MDIDQLIAAAQSVVDGLTAIKNAPVATAPSATITEVDVKESDGSETVLDNPPASSAPTE
jgi:hypothetical protein